MNGRSAMQKKVAVGLSLGAVLILLSAVPLPVKAETVGAVYTMTNDPAGNSVEWVEGEIWAP